MKDGGEVPSLRALLSWKRWAESLRFLLLPEFTPPRSRGPPASSFCCPLVSYSSPWPVCALSGAPAGAGEATCCSSRREPARTRRTADPARSPENARGATADF
uniref:Solute carrier family 46 member 3 n=1 Tax=Rousettus aegyptiacus TaxID=9407 RepID=A0A7J8DZD8_ROUAE|nr:solute carrier family 46 member 3 [Rousettus aegyptiacus]